MPFIPPRSYCYTSLFAPFHALSHFIYGVSLLFPAPAPPSQPLINGGSSREEEVEEDSEGEGEGAAAVAAAAASLEEEAAAAVVSASSTPGVVGGSGAKSDPANTTEGVPGS